MSDTYTNRILKELLLSIFLVVFAFLIGINGQLYPLPNEPDPPAKPNVTNYTGIIKCTPDGHCHCPENPVTDRYPDLDDLSCENYYLCHKGIAFHRWCGPRRAFHPEMRECLPRSTILYRTCPNAIDCVTNGYVPDPRDCTMYYMCFYKQAYHYGCKFNHYYNVTRRRCVMDKERVQLCNKNRKLKTGIKPFDSSNLIPIGFMPAPKPLNANLNNRLQQGQGRLGMRGQLGPGQGRGRGRGRGPGGGGPMQQGNPNRRFQQGQGQQQQSFMNSNMNPNANAPGVNQQMNQMDMQMQPLPTNQLAMQLQQQQQQQQQLQVNQIPNGGNYAGMNMMGQGQGAIGGGGGGQMQSGQVSMDGTGMMGSGGNSPDYGAGSVSGGGDAAGGMPIPDYGASAGMDGGG